MNMRVRLQVVQVMSRASLVENAPSVPFVHPSTYCPSLFDDPSSLIIVLE